MHHLFSRSSDWIAEPSAWTCLLLGAAVALRRRPATATALTTAAVLVLVAFSCPAVSSALTRAADASAHDTSRPGVVYDVAVVLGDGFATSPRIERGLEIMHEGRARHLIFSGTISFDQLRLLKKKVLASGVPADRFLFETRSDNTRENALESSRIVAERGFASILLITSASHMKRGLGSFRRLGLRPDTLPVDEPGHCPGALEWLPRTGALLESTEALHELVGRIAYRLFRYSE
ncbi:MAG TPA: YdcF family protein [Anaeromyxobacteraceae bacterium]|nr:YdcF family protein [Anaeromyxobacteraceae bacterium]